MNKKIQKKEAIKFGWEEFKKNLWFFIGAMLIIAVISGISSYASKGMERAPLFGSLLNIASVIFGIIVQIGLIKAILKVVDGQKPSFDDLFSESRYFLRYVGASLLYGLIVIGGLLLFIAPGIIWGIKFQFYKYLIVDKNMGVLESLKKSAEMTKGYTWELFLFGLVMFGITALGALAFMVGLVVAVPVVAIATAFVYKKVLPYAAEIHIATN